jgi:hypothetical protein
MGISTTQTGMGPRLTLSTATGTLAQFAYALGVGSLCFCCGHSLVSSTGSRENVFLVCPRCGAEVATEQGPALQQAA